MVVLLGAEWFSSLVPVHLLLLLLLMLYCYSIVGYQTLLVQYRTLFVVILTHSFPHIELIYFALSSLFKLYSQCPLASGFWSLMCVCFSPRLLDSPLSPYLRTCTENSTYMYHHLLGECGRGAIKTKYCNQLWPGKWLCN